MALKTTFFLLAILTSAIVNKGNAISATPDVAVTIKPVHSIVSFVMEGIGKPSLIIGGAASAHGFQLRPSQTKMISDAALLVWVGPTLETFAKKPIQTFRKGKRTLTLSNLEGLVRHSYRSRYEQINVRQADGHEHHKNKKKRHQNAHDHNRSHKHKKARPAQHAHKNKHSSGHGHGHGHGHGDLSEDPHYWLDPQNAVIFASAVSRTLAEMDRPHAAKYRANAKRFKNMMSALTDKLSSQLLPIKNVDYVVFHDAYQYFEKRFKLRPGRAIALDPETAPGARHVSRVSRWISDQNIKCVFSEPQFSPKLSKTLAARSGAEARSIDPLGANLQPGSSLYTALLENMADALSGCLR